MLPPQTANTTTSPGTVALYEPPYVEQPASLNITVRGEDTTVTNKLAVGESVQAQEDSVAVGDAPAVSKPAFGNSVAAQDGNAVVGDATTVAAAKPVESKPVAGGLANENPAEIMTPEAEAEADAKEKAEALKLMEEVGEPQRAPLKVMGEKNVSNNLADYGEYYSSSDE